MMRNATGTERVIPFQRHAASAGSHDDSASLSVPPPVTSDDSEPSTATTVHLLGDPTRAATPTAAPDLQPTFAVNPLRDPERYQILGEHGRGGLGRVSRARDRELGRDVAIKELISRSSLSEVRFLREAMITARLEHPGIVPMYEAGRWPDGTHYYAMKLVAGSPLRDLIVERTTVDQRIGLLHHVIAVADAMAYAHGRNIIHRDLKPANVIVGDFGETIVIDWGLAKDLSAPEDANVGDGGSQPLHDSDLTTVGAVLGTPAYMAPEQERGERVDQRADVFAIGAMLWELCSLQKVPPTNLRQRHRMLRRAAIDQDLAVIIDKALDPDPEYRYPDAGALAADLKAFKSGARMTLDNHTDRADWPATLSSYANGDRLRFATRGPHPFVWVAVPFALMLGALGVAGIAGVGTSGLVSAIAGIGAAAFAVAVLMSAAYSTWGVMEIERRGSEWIVTRYLGRVRFVSAFAVGRVRSTELYSPPPFVVLWPGGAGLHVRVHMSDRERPVEVGAGLRLDGTTLHSLQTLFTPIP